MSPSTVSTLAAVTAITGVLAISQLVADLFLRDRSRVSDRVDAEFNKGKAGPSARKTPLFKNLRAMAEQVGDDARPTLRQKFEAMVEQSGLETSPSNVLTTSAVVGVALGVVGFLARKQPLDAAVAGLVGAVLPIWRVKKARDARIEKLRSQLADAFELMARVVRAGQTLGQSMMAVAEEFPAPVSTEFARCFEQQNLGLPPEVTFRDLNRRTGIVELKIFVLAVLVQQQTGGNLAELLNKLAGVVRERYIIQGTIQTLTSEGRMQGWILAGLPPVMLVFLFLINRDYAMAHRDHLDLLLGTFGVEMIGVWWIRQIVKLEF